MKKTSRIGLAAILAGALALAGCAYTPVMPPRGLIWNDQQAPLYKGYEPGVLAGQASAHNVLFLAGWGNAGLDEAMRDGGIRELKHVDYRVQNYLLIYQKFTTIAYGN